MYLLTKNLKIRKKSKKLNHVKIELFFIKVVKKSVNYELDLPKNVKVFLVFHISLLKSADLSTSIQETFHYHSQKKNRFEIERILEKKNQRYLVK
jgi:Na+/phosphate symporter